MTRPYRTALDLEATVDAIKALQQSGDPRVQALLAQYDADSLRAEAQHLANDLYDDAERPARNVTPSTPHPATLADTFASLPAGQMRAVVQPVSP